MSPVQTSPHHADHTTLDKHPFDDFLNEIEDGYYETDLRGNFIAVNNAFISIGGYSREHLINKKTRNYANYTDAATAHRLHEVFFEVFTTGIATPSLEFSFRRKDDSLCHIDISVSLTRDESGNPKGFRGFARDISERRAIENALTTRINMLSLLQQVDTELNHNLNPEAVLMVGMNAAILISGADCGFIGLIEAGHLRVVREVGANDTLELDLDEGVVGRALRLQTPELVADVAADEDYVVGVPGMQAEIAVPLVARERLIGVLNLETTERERFTPEVYEFILLLTTRLASALDNATLLQTSQEQLKALQELYTQVSSLERLKTDMIRIAAHDMRGPLSLISTYADLLKSDLDPHLDLSHRSYFDAIGRAIDRMIKLSTDVLSLERIQELQTAPSEQIQLDRLVREAAEEFRNEAKNRSLTLRIVTPKQPVFVVGDSVELNEAVSNLIANAIKYTPDDGRVAVNLSVTKDRAVFEVVDNGFGIPEADQKRLFQPFYRVKTRETVSITGTGLGLHLVKKIIERHGGKVAFASEHGVGSRFGFELPIALEPAIHARTSVQRKQKVSA